MVAGQSVISTGQFLRMLANNDPDAQYGICRLKRKPSGEVSMRLAALMSPSDPPAFAGEPDVYFHINPMRQPENAWSSGGKHDLTAVTCFGIDFDSSSKDGKYAPIEVINEVLAKSELRFGAVVASGSGGIHAYLLLSENAIATPVRSKRAIHAIEAHLQSLLDTYGCGYTLDTGSQPARLLRLPGSVHNKTGNVVTVISATGERYSLDQIEATLGLNELLVKTFDGETSEATKLVEQMLDEKGMPDVLDIFAHYGWRIDGDAVYHPASESGYISGIRYDGQNGKEGVTIKSTGTRIFEGSVWYSRVHAYTIFEYAGNWSKCYYDAEKAMLPTGWEFCDVADTTDPRVLRMALPPVKRTGGGAKAKSRLTDLRNEAEATGDVEKSIAYCLFAIEEGIALDPLPAAWDAAVLRYKLAEFERLSGGDTGKKYKLRDLPPEDVAAGWLAENKLNGIATLRYWSGQFWHWSEGTYSIISRDDAAARLVKHLDRRFTHTDSAAISNVLSNAQHRCLVGSNHAMPIWLENGNRAKNWAPGDTISTRNVIINLPRYLLGDPEYSEPVTPAFFTSSATDYDFDPDAPTPVRWHQFLDSVFGDDHEQIELLQQWFGYCLTADVSQQKIMLMVGPTRCGKGTIAKVLEWLVGQGSAGAPTLKGLATNFGLQDLIGKSIAICGDVRLSGRTDISTVVERLLSISGGDSITIDRKNREPVTTRLNTRFVLLSNELPTFTDASGAIANRLVIIQMTKSFLWQEDLRLASELEKEKAGILLWAIQGWASLHELGRFIKPKSSDDAVDQMAAIASPIHSFVDDRCELGAEAKVRLDLLYRHYRDWCSKQGIDRPPKQHVFSRDLTAAFPDLKRDRQQQKDKTKVTIVSGINVVVETEDLE